MASRDEKEAGGALSCGGNDVEEFDAMDARGGCPLGTSNVHEDDLKRASLRTERFPEDWERCKGAGVQTL